MRRHRGVDGERGLLRDVGEEVELVVEVLEQRALRDTGLAGDHVEAATGVAVPSELGHRGVQHPLAPPLVQVVPGRFWHIVTL